MVGIQIAPGWLRPFLNPEGKNTACIADVTFCVQKVQAGILNLQPDLHTETTDSQNVSAFETFEGNR